MAILNKSFLFSLLAAAAATPVAILEERQSQPINIQVSMTGSQFRTLEDPSTLKTYLQSKGYTYNVNYNQLSQGVVAIDQYFSQKAAQTTSLSSDYGFSANTGPPQRTSLSTTLQGGPSRTNNTMTASTDLVSVFSFSDGNAATAGGAIQRTIATSSTSSSGKANSTANVVGSQNLNQIDVSSSVTGASDRRVVNGSPEDALTAGDCAAAATGASARSSITSILTVPVNVTSPSRGVSHVGSSFCEAGVAGKQGTSLSSTQGTLTNGGVAAVVTCNGVQSSGTPNVVFEVKIQGSYSSNTGFSGTLVASRTASVAVSCN